MTKEQVEAHVKALGWMIEKLRGLSTEDNKRAKTQEN